MEFTDPPRESRRLHFQAKEGARSMMIREPQFDTYSIPARFCFGIAMLGGAVLLAVAITSIYFMQ